jgi:hypothetical protein
MKKIYTTLVICLLMGIRAFAQTDNGAIRIILQDKSTKEVIPFANVVAYKDGVQVGVATTNMDGEALIKPLQPGKYTVKGIYVGFQATEIKDVVVGEGKTAYVTIPLASGEGVNLKEVDIVEYQVPLIDPDTKSGQTVTREDYMNLATKDINSVAATTAGVYQADENDDINVRGGRTGATTYFIDGVKVFGRPNLPQQAIDQLNVITGGVPANYGDLTSGAISISTRGPQSKYFGSVELISSQLTDPYGYNSLGFSFGGPIYKKRDSTRRTVLGFIISGQGNYVKEPDPPATPIWVVNDDKLAQLRAAPLRRTNTESGFIRESEFLTKNDMHTQKFRPNSVDQLLSLQGKIDYAPTSNLNISLGSTFEYQKTRIPGVFYTLLNSENHPLNTNRVIRGNVSIRQKFSNATGAEQAKKQSLVTNAYFNILLSYEDIYEHRESARHGDNFFEYGYVGKFERNFLEENFAYNYLPAPTYSINGQPVNSYTYSGRQELPVVYTPGGINPDMESYTNYYVANAPGNPFNTMKLDAIAANNGLRNGDLPGDINNLFLNFGTNYPGYFKQHRQQYRIAASFNADVKNHGITVGMEYDQRFARIFSFNSGFVNGPASLWTRMRQLANQHTEQLDLSNPILNAELSGVVPYYYFNYAYDQSRQTQFSESLLEKLGLPRNYTGFVNIDEVHPSDLDLDMFSAEDLLGNNASANLVTYNGYSHTGVRTAGGVDIDKFLNEKDKNGRNTFPIGDFRAIYASVYIMDKFDFRDIKFNVGLRVDRYDANQPVLKDKYAVHELARVSDLSSLTGLPPGFTENVPANLSKNAAVYVAQNPSGGKSPLAIRGYRLEDQWYNSEGIEISDPNLVAVDGRPIPLLKDNANYDKPMSAGAFTAYKPVIIPQPRVAFSFPISDVANFFAHYDKVMQRPINSQISPLDYYFLDASSTTPLITNPNQQPQQSIDYELGYQQVLNERKNASLTITSFYREMRNLINRRMVTGAYPKNYVMYDNIDFATVKGMSFVFDFRRTGGSRINLNYTLQFAEGSGSNVNSGANLANSGQPNLRVLIPLDYDQRHSFVVGYDYRFGTKKDYKGPTFKRSEKTVNVFEDVGFNLSFILGSGTPYTRWNTAVPLGGARSNIVGQINGSQKPWNFRTNLRVDKNIPLTWNKEDEANKKTANLNVYVQVLNLFNRRNVLNVYNFTGQPDDDAYLTSTQAQAAIAQANSSASFIDMYSIRVNAPSNFSLPRQVRIGVMFDF